MILDPHSKRIANPSREGTSPTTYANRCPDQRKLSRSRPQSLLHSLAMRRGVAVAEKTALTWENAGSRDGSAFPVVAALNFLTSQLFAILRPLRHIALEQEVDQGVRVSLSLCVSPRCHESRRASDTTKRSGGGSLWTSNCARGAVCRNHRHRQRNDLACAVPTGLSPISQAPRAYARG